MSRRSSGLVLYGLITMATLLVANQALAARYESPNYTIDASIGNNFGGDTTSDSYRMTSSGGESIIGNGAGGSYMLDQGYVGQLNQSLQLSVQPKGLVANYLLDEAQGEMAFDSSANANNGELTNGPTWVEGRVDGAIMFDGVDDYIEIPDHESLRLNGSLTIGAWVKLVNNGGYQPIVSKKTDSEYEFAADWRGGKGNGLAWRSQDSGISVNFPGFFTNRSDVWTHVVVTVESSGTGTDNLSAYRDGVLFGTTSIPQRDQKTGSLNIGRSLGIVTGVAHYAKGSIDNVKLLNRVFTAQEVKAEYEAGISGSALDLTFAEEIVPGVSHVAEAEAVVLTDAPGYNLTIQQDGDLTSGEHSIPAVTGSIGAPANWSEGTTKGLGFTLTSASAAPIAAKWNSGNAYAPLPANATTFYSRSGFSGGNKDIVGLRYRLDVAPDQPTGQYKNTVTYTGVIVP